MKIIDSGEPGPIEHEASCQCGCKFSFTRADTRNILFRDTFTKKGKTFTRGDSQAMVVVICPKCKRDYDATEQVGTEPAITD